MVYKFAIRDPDGNLKPELKIGMAIDGYKLTKKNLRWEKMLETMPEVEQFYDLVKEEVGKGVTDNTQMCYRFYKLKVKQ